MYLKLKDVNYDIAMNEKYSDCIEKVSQILFETIAKREENLKEKIFEIDTDLLSLLRAIGLRVMSMLLTMLTIQVTNQVKKKAGKLSEVLKLNIQQFLVN